MFNINRYGNANQTTVRRHFIPSRMTTFKTTGNYLIVGTGLEQLELCAVFRNVKYNYCRTQQSHFWVDIRKQGLQEEFVCPRPWQRHSQ